jgi:hypothetical protein
MEIADRIPGLADGSAGFTTSSASWGHIVECEFPGCARAAPLAHFHADGEQSLCFDHRQLMFHDAYEFYRRWDDHDDPGLRPPGSPATA